jgi:hypothetical protein
VLGCATRLLPHHPSFSLADEASAPLKYITLRTELVHSSIAS